MDLAGPKIRTVFKSKVKLKIEEGSLIQLVDESRIEDQKIPLDARFPTFTKGLKKVKQYYLMMEQLKL